MSSKTVEEIKQRLGILELIESYIKVEKAGSSFRALCPFHNEKTPSFHISPDRNNYYCFGCGAKGDIFSFVQEFEGLDFMGALRLLADRVGVEIIFDKDENRGQKDILFNILEKTNSFLEYGLDQSTKAKDYLLSRGLTDYTIKQWRIGYVKDGWDNIYSHLKKEGFNPLDIEKSGLIKKKENGKEYYDRFRDRLMFPIFDASSRVVGFSGRTLKKDGKEAKYINSPETSLFSKSHVLFGYNFAKQSIRKNNFSILVEGQFDVVLSHQVGYKNTVATSGTALTEYQIDLLKRLSDRLIIAMDGDGAGFRASQKAWEMALEKGMDVKIASMNQKEDPADIIKRNPDDWKNIIKNSVHIIDFLISSVLSSNFSDERTKIKEVAKVVIPYVHILPSKLEQSHFVKRISDTLNISEEVVWQEVENSTSNIDSSYPKITKQEHSVNSDRFASLKELLGIIKWQQSKSDSSMDTIKTQAEINNLIGEEILLKITSSLDMEKMVFKIEERYGEDVDMQKVVNDLLVDLRRKVLEHKRVKLKKELVEAENNNQEEKSKEILEKINTTSKELEDIVTKHYK